MEMPNLDSQLDEFISNYVDCCISTSWLDDEIYKFQWAHWLNSRADFETMTNAELFQLAIDSQKENYSGNIGVQFIKQGAREKLSKYIGMDDIDMFRDFYKGKSLESIDFSVRNISFPIISCWLSTFFPDKIYPASKIAFSQLVKNIFSVKVSNGHIAFIEDMQPYLKIIDKRLRENSSYTLLLQQKLGVSKLVKLDYNWAVQDFMLYLDKHPENVRLQTEKRYWIFAPGEKASKWEEFYNSGIMGLGWDAIGDLNNYSSKKEVVSKLQKLENTEGSKSNDANACWDFKDTISIGDIVIVKKGRYGLLGYGTVTSDYYYDDSLSTYQKRRKVKWLVKGNWEIDQPLPLKTLTDITKYSVDNSYFQFYYQNLIAIMNNIPQTSLNQILYGPPGTGKTYATINMALEILGIDLEYNSREEIKKKYEEKINSGHIAFTTFHQSMSYEDFVEGIKPVLNEEGQDEVKYEIKSGIFKTLSKKAVSEYYKISKPSENDSFQRLNLFDKAWDSLVAQTRAALDNGEAVPLKTLTEKEMEIVSVSDQGNLILRPKVVNALDYVVSYSRIQKLFEAFEDLSVIKNIDREFRAVIGGSNSTAYWCVLNCINGWIEKNKNTKDYQQNTAENSFNENLVKFDQSAVKKNLYEDVPRYVLIIDEINRGNVSQIFGELITLLEEDKRLGMDESIELLLPYSKERFAVPPNLYIIGTMNTADRSVEALDTALRRRFNFKELMPDTKVVLEKGFEDFPREAIMKKLNERIELLLDRNHTLGHAYFIKDDFKSSFENQIIPLLQEYFYNDCGKIGLILGKSFVREKMIDGSALTNSLLADFPTRNEAYVSKTYELIPFEELNFATAIESLLSS